MATIRLKYITSTTKPNGKTYYYFRRNGSRIPMPTPIGSKAFNDAYAAALGGNHEQQERKRPNTPSGSFSALLLSYYQSPAFTQLRPSTKATYRGILERFNDDHGHRLVIDMQRRHLITLRDRKASTPSAANNLIRLVRLLLDHALDLEWIETNHARTVKPIRTNSEGFHSWSEDEIAQFESYYPTGTRARLAFDLLLHTGQRRSDVVKLGPQHLSRDKQSLTFDQQKTGTRLTIPIDPALVSSLDKAPSSHLAFLVTAQNAPFTANGFGNYFRDLCDKASLPHHCASHGLRKAAARRLADAGCTSHQIAAITGHKSLKEVEHYTRAANQTTLAKDAHRALAKKIIQRTGE